MPKLGGTTRWAVVGGGLAVLLASCAFGVTTPAADVTGSAATLTGAVHNTVAGPTTYWFDYDRDATFGVSHTPHNSVDVTDTSKGYPVSAPVAGLAAGNEYHSRLCARGTDGKGLCGHEQVFTTVGDSVTGRGSVFSLPELGFSIGAFIDASSAPDGSNAAGSAVYTPGTYYFRLADSGSVTCLRIDGNRATVGFVADPPDIGDPTLEPIPELLFIEDNGAAGDRLGQRTISAPATTCPAATDGDFPDFEVGGLRIPPVLESGNFVIHDDAS